MQGDILRAQLIKYFHNLQYATTIYIPTSVGLCWLVIGRYTDN